MPIDPDEIWEAFRRGREQRPGLSVADFARDHGADGGEVRSWLEAAVAFEALQPPAPLVEGLAQGLEFAGYRLLRELGRGGFGLVYEARDAAGRLVALKILNPLVALDGPRQQELLREARVAEGLEHSGIVCVLACGVERGHAWFASELVQGEPLTAEALERHAGTSALELGIQLADALAHAHSRGVMHRDLKPANILLDRAGRVRVLDFGLARVDEISISTRPARTSDGAGTPQYMAPEQLGRGPVGAWSDVYAMGLVLLGLVAPAARQWIHDPARVRERLSGRATVPPARWLRGLSSDLRRVLARALEPVHEDRYPTATELAEDLTALRAGLPLPHGRPGLPSRTLRSWRRHPLRALVPLAVLLGVTLAVRHFWWLAPMPVYIDALLSGKVLHVDGVERGLVPTTIHLRPGPHEATLQYGDFWRERPIFKHSFVVEPRRKKAMLLPLNYWASVPVVPGLGDEEIPPGEGAWVVLAVRESPSEWGYSVSPWERWASAKVPTPPVHLRLLGDQTELLFEGVVPALCQLRVPVGYIRMEVSVEGFRPVSKEAVINEDRLSIASIALDVAHSPWHTLVVHSPIDFGLDARIVERRNLRLYVEAMSFQDSRMFANIAYFGPEDPSRRAGLTLRLDLPIVPQEIELFRVFEGNFGATGWTEFSAGPSRRELRSVFAIAGQTEAAAPAHIERGGGGHGLGQQPQRPWEAAMAPLIERGGRELWLDYDVGPGPVGDSYVYMQILRAESLPNYVPDRTREAWAVPQEGDFLWHPALLIRVR